jgi:hypothetical protein
MSQTPTLGRIVITAVDPKTNNGATEAAAVISRVWSQNPTSGAWLVNLRVLLDQSTVEWKTSVDLYASQEDADQAKPDSIHKSWWPARAA